MKILVIGGSYFFGRWFVQYAYRKHDITVLNRGNMPLGLKEIREWKADRNSMDELLRFKGEYFDCIVDFCAYNKGDISSITNIFNTKRYVFISTVDVYKKGLGCELNVDSPLEDRVLPGAVGAYINGKVSLENELKRCAKEKNIQVISVRPSVLYGPANYAPRESLYYEWIKNTQKIVTPINSSGEFQFIYVEDASKGLLNICESDSPYEAYNFCNEKIDTYESFHKALHVASTIDFEEVPLEITDILANEIPLPFPLTKEESEYYVSDRYCELGIVSTTLEEGLFKAFSVLS